MNTPLKVLEENKERMLRQFKLNLEAEAKLLELGMNDVTICGPPKCHRIPTHVEGY